MDPLLMIGVLAAVGLVVLVVRRHGRRAPGTTVTDDATLEARLAAGEIDRIEFELLRSVLRRR